MTTMSRERSDWGAGGISVRQSIRDRSVFVEDVLGRDVFASKPHFERHGRIFVERQPRDIVILRGSQPRV